jgi:hypothetical protein
MNNASESVAGDRPRRAGAVFQPIEQEVIAEKLASGWKSAYQNGRGESNFHTPVFRFHGFQHAPLLRSLFADFAQ